MSMNPRLLTGQRPQRSCESSKSPATRHSTSTETCQLFLACALEELNADNAMQVL